MEEYSYDSIYEINNLKKQKSLFINLKNLKISNENSLSFNLKVVTTNLFDKTIYDYYFNWGYDINKKFLTNLKARNFFRFFYYYK